jgi:TPR repeat protein
MKTAVLAAVLVALCPIASAELKDGALAYSRGDFATATRELRALADEGHAMAQYLLGASLLNAKPPLFDLAAAEAWLKKAADQGNLAAMRDLGKLNWFAKSPSDPPQAAQWLRQGSDRGDAESQHLLGLLYLDGKGVERRATEAYKWLLLASERGHVLSSVILRESRNRFSEQERAEGQQLAAAWKPIR